MLCEFGQYRKLRIDKLKTVLEQDRNCFHSSRQSGKFAIRGFVDKHRSSSKELTRPPGHQLPDQMTSLGQHGPMALLYILVLYCIIFSRDITLCPKSTILILYLVQYTYKLQCAVQGIWNFKIFFCFLLCFLKTLETKFFMFYLFMVIEFQLSFFF